MILRTPAYYKNFRCIADKCHDNCCVGWEIDVDEETAAFYESVSGEFGERLHRNIQDGHFVLRKDESCPFLNECGLCDIYIQLGEDKLCGICSDHPRYYEWFGNIKEAGTGLCCEAAVPLVLEGDFSLTETEISEEEDFFPESCREYFEYLSSAREFIFNRLSDYSVPLEETLSELYIYGKELQMLSDCDEFILPEWKKAENLPKNNMKTVLGEFFAALEPMDESWIPYVRECSEKTFSGINPEHEKYLRNIAIYFIFRYFLKAVYDGETVSKINFCILSIFVLAHLFNCGNGDFSTICETARRYSKEIEYCEENIEKIFDTFADKPVLF